MYQKENGGIGIRKSIQLGAAFIGVVVGAGFASGQEILQFFTSFGFVGLIGSIVATLLFIVLGMNLTRLGSRLQSNSHKEVIYHICGRPFGLIIDVLITFFLFGVTVVMFAGAGTIFEHQFGVPGVIGSLLMAILTIISVTLKIEKVIALISMMTPLLVILVLITTVHAFLNLDMTKVDYDMAMTRQAPAASNWLLAAVLYVSYNIAIGASMLTVLGGTVKNEKVASRGGAIGGIGLGILIILINVSMLTQLEEITDVPMPMLLLANNISPTMGLLMAVVLLGMIYNTAVGTLYAFVARFVNAGTVRFNGFVMFVGMLAFGASFVGFVSLVGTVYPMMGYLGFMLIGAIVFSWFAKG